MIGLERKRRRPKPLVVISITLAAVLGFILLVWAVNGWGVNEPPGVEDVAFQAMFPEDAIFNRGLRITSKVETIDQSEGVVSFSLKNFTTETLKIYSGIMTVHVWRYDPESNHWEDITDPVIYAIMPDSFFMSAHQSVDVGAQMQFTDPVDEGDWLRFVVTGTGETTGRIFVAYVDLPIE